MQADPPVAPADMNDGAPIVMAFARFDDGTQVAGGVYKWAVPPEPMNVKFMWVFDASGTQYPGWPIDTSDDEDFLQTGYLFSVTEGGQNEYLLNIVEAGSEVVSSNDVPQEKSMTTPSPSAYTFKFTLLDSWNPTTPNAVYTGTLTLNPNDSSSISGNVQFDNDFAQPIDIQGTSSSGYEDTGTLVNASGSSSEAQINLAFIFVADGTAGGGEDSLLGGMVSLFDRAAEEWNPYIIQAVAAQMDAGQQTKPVA
jgi:hypothetical protein